MTYKPTILNVCAGIYIASCIAYTIIYYPVLSANEGWGVVAMIALLGSGFIFLLIDLLLQYFIKDRKTMNITGLIIVIVATLLYITA